MPVLAWIIVASVVGGVLSVVAAAAFAFNARTAHVPILISYAVGALLGAVFLDILPHAFGMADSIEQIAATILIGILLFFVLEKLVLWRHCHVDQCEAHEAQPAQHDHGRSGMMIMIGDTFHNFVDGILIAAAFLADVQLGLVTAIAIIAHEVPQEVGDFLVLLHSG
ncbi:MAG: ZIP family metal transporter, partial [Betaproteobacteria bacterium]|nr:ZIP family metal transporter [Betaproteobacteria bacterium]